MKVTNWFGAALALFFLFSAIANLAPGEPEQRFQFGPPGGPPTHSGRPLTPAEVSTLEGAINNIAPPPESLKFADENGDSHTVACWVIAYDLICQLHEGRMEAETIATGNFWTLPDSLKTPEGDPMNIDPAAVAKAADSAAWMRIVEGCLVHEWWHKNQDTAALRNNDQTEEIAPYNVMSAYFCSTAVNPGDTNDPLTKWARDEARRRQPPVPGNPIVRAMNVRRVDDHLVFLNCDTAVTGGRDSLTSFSPDNIGRHSFPLFPLRGSDLAIVENPPFLPPGHKLAVVYGGFPLSGVARILLLDFFDGQVIAPVWSHDFGPPAHPPMFFYSAAKRYPNGPWFVLDSLNHQILLMQDAMYGDGVPDEITSVFASAAWPGMGALVNARGLEAVAHPVMGQGVMVLEEDVHLHDAFYPHDRNYFLIDTDGNLQADVMLPLPLYEFLAFTPVIQVPRPWPGDNWVNLFASWEHDIAVWSTDSTGEIMIEQLGLMHMAPGIDAECLLSRPLLAGEYIMPVDMQTGKRPRPKQVVASAPDHLVIQLDSGNGVLLMNWEAVAGATMYAIWTSDDGVNFFDTGLRTPENFFAMPLPPFEKQFYQVTALR